MSALEEHPILGRKVRAGDWRALAVGTPRLVADAIRAGDAGRAGELAAFAKVEFRIVFDIYTQWFADVARCLADKGVPAGEVAARHAAIRAALARFHRSAGEDRAVVWDEIAADLDAVAAGRLAGEAALAAIERARERWRDLHDCEVDQLSALFAEVMARFGEAALGGMYEGWVIGDWFARRYARFDVSRIPWPEAAGLLVHLGFEGHHGHLSGPDRDGTIAFEEDAEKVTLFFAPCGSGGRTVTGEPRDGLPPLAETGIADPTLRGRHDFAWNTPGVCAYCAHCCLLHETLPIAAYGYPVRVTRPPTAREGPDALCSWTVYKDPRRIPEEAYARVGARKPPAGAPLGSAGRAAREAMMGSGEGSADG